MGRKFLKVMMGAAAIGVGTRLCMYNTGGLVWSTKTCFHKRVEGCINAFKASYYSVKGKLRIKLTEDVQLSKKLQKLMMKCNVIFNEVVTKLVFMECAVCVCKEILSIGLKCCNNM